VVNDDDIDRALAELRAEQRRISIEKSRISGKYGGGTKKRPKRKRNEAAVKRARKSARKARRRNR
jgi:hypothetical protein